MEKTNQDSNTYKPKRRVLVPSWVWFWVHKLVFFLITAMVYSNLSDDDYHFSSWFFENEVYVISNQVLTRLEVRLHNVVTSGALQIGAIVLMCLATLLGIRAYRKENADIDLVNDLKKKGGKKALIRFIKGFADILLDLIMVLMAVKSFNAVNFTFLSADISDCTLSSKKSQLRELEKDKIYATDYKGEDTLPTGDVVTERFDIEDVSVEMTDSLTYKPSEVSPYVWSIWLPGDSDILIWLDFENRVDSMSDFIMVDIKHEREETIQLYALKCGDKVFPISEHDYDTLSHRITETDNDYFEVTYYRNSHILSDWRVLSEEDDLYEKALESAKPILEEVVDLISYKEYEAVADHAGFLDGMSAERLEEIVEDHLARYDAKETSDYYYSRRNNDLEYQIRRLDDGSGFELYYYLRNNYDWVQAEPNSDDEIEIHIALWINMKFMYADDGGVKAFITDCQSLEEEISHHSGAWLGWS